MKKSPVFWLHETRSEERRKRVFPAMLVSAREVSPPCTLTMHSTVGNVLECNFCATRSKLERVKLNSSLLGAKEQFCSLFNKKVLVFHCADNNNTSVFE